MNQPVDEDARKRLRSGLFEGVKQAVSGNPGNTISGQPVPEFLAGPEPADPFGKFQHRGGRATCDRWARGDRAGFTPGRDGWLRQLCTPYLDQNLPEDAEFGPPYTGGQCEGFEYLIFGDSFDPNTGAPNPNNPIFFGTLTGPVELITTPGPVGCTPPQFSQGAQAMRTVGDPGGGIPVRSPGCVSFPTLKNLRAVRSGGNTDLCGDPPPGFDPGAPSPTVDPNPGPVGGPPGYPFPDFDITINPDGTINVDFGDGEPPETIDPGPDLPEDNPGGGGGGGGGAPTNPGSPGGTGQTGDGGEDEGEAPEGEELTGVLVTILSAHENANKFDRSPVDVFRGVGYVAMGYPGLLGVDTSASVMQSPQFFHAQQRGLTAWRVRANVGFNLETTPYYRETES